MPPSNKYSRNRKRSVWRHKEVEVIKGKERAFVRSKASGTGKVTG